MIQRKLVKGPTYSNLNVKVFGKYMKLIAKIMQVVVLVTKFLILQILLKDILPHFI